MLNHCEAGERGTRLTYLADHQVEATECTTGDILRIHGLRSEAHCGGWGHGALERIRSGYGEGFPSECEGFIRTLDRDEC